MSPATIQARDATKRFGKTTALDGFNLVAEPGEVVALLGPNGAGKTTFVRAVATLLRLDGGELIVAGHDAGHEPAAVRQVIGLAGQFAAVEPAMTGRENLEMVARLFGRRHRDAKRAAAAVLDQMGLNAAADQQVKSYSGGMRRRLDLAPVWSASRGCCSSTSRRRASTRAAGPSCGTRSVLSSGLARTSC
jgi:ABC-2 type transport system ATP-binding protein